MPRPTPLSGFPEWLPAQRIIEQRAIEILTRTFELHGFASVATRAVEPLDQLLRKGETSKEVYVLRRLHADPEQASGDGDLGLHFDLTVPFARYVLENAGHLSFPFKRYQIQPVWRGERPQDGRFREFWQADIDVVGEGSLPDHLEIDVPLIAAEALTALSEIGLPPVRVLVNDRRVAESFYRGVGLEAVDEVLRCVDKLAKIGRDGVAALLRDELGASEAQVAATLDLAELSGGVDVVERVRVLAIGAGVGRADPQHLADLETGLSALERLLREAQVRAPGVVVADMSIARGLDYYTGAVYETVLVGHEKLGSICSGGRYDSLASDGARTYPGVGISIGLSRVLSRLFSAGLVTASRSVPTAVLVAVADEESRSRSNQVAAQLRARGVPCDVAPAAAKFGKQIRYADRRGIPYVWFPGAPGEADAVKDIRSGDQVEADATVWAPPAADWFPRAVVTASD
ncbi:histidine--tRNA ligase [Litorihabitans aurantiacus]|uniref:Histidine--tRNA ligase n=1 Tax=Litorihabitans aurantiacus TaxID=1930061 RepID=A0AA37XDW4_9MICO|nr:histidine--tRNA ligase [Litorihabitans aurantiacus]GMA31370.1 histidine--tRNA ligase [Litorihabitans aurantiacus]